MNADGLIVQYGCGLSAPAGWINFDASPTLRIQKLPIVGKILTRNSVRFPDNVLFADVVRGLPLEDGVCRAIYASHVLEHLSLRDFQMALRETRRVLKAGGVFRLVVPDLKILCKTYLDAYDRGDPNASHNFMRSSHLGAEERPSGAISLAAATLGNSQHLWMWDLHSLRKALVDAEFAHVRKADFGDSTEMAFLQVEQKDRFLNAIAFEAIK